ncbi:MAG: polymerase sigma-70 factor [Candidatus Eremiobacteraeota bacterium]|nr:polymerase sigma-70 factor [Candidatus Eremiobacteraeota bacterium]
MSRSHGVSGLKGMPYENPAPAPSGLQRRPADDARRLATFDEYRPLLFSIAYRMLGTIADAEDMVQETFIRWQRTDEAEVRDARALLVTIVSRLCINQLQSARVKRVEYVGQWLPEPVMTDQENDPLGVLRLDESLSMALMVLLERLTPTERAVFLLREVFGYTYAEIARALGQTESNSRQLFHRARAHVGTMRRRFHASGQEHMQLLERFVDASRNGDMDGLLRLLASDVTMHSDGGGKAIAVPNLIHGAEKVARGLVHGLTHVLPKDLRFKTGWINGDAGVINYLDGKPYSVLVLDVRNALVTSIYIVTNPEKLIHLPPLED